LPSPLTPLSLPLCANQDKVEQLEDRADEAENVAGELRWRLGEAEAKNNFYESMVGAYPGLLFRVVRAERCDVNSVGLKDKFKRAIGVLQKDGCEEDEIKPKCVFYTAEYKDEGEGSAEYQEGERDYLDEKYTLKIEKITSEGFKSELHPPGSSIPRKVRDGEICNPARGVHFHKHADYSFSHQLGRDPVIEDQGATIMADLVTGKSYVKKKKSGEEGFEPMRGFHSHRAHNNLVYYVMDTAQVTPTYVIYWEVFQSRAGIGMDR